MADAAGMGAGEAALFMPEEFGFDEFAGNRAAVDRGKGLARAGKAFRSEEHTSELQSLMRISYAVFCLRKKKNNAYYQTCSSWRQHHSRTKINHKLNN